MEPSFQVDQPGLGLPRDFLVDPGNFEDQITAYKDYIVDVARIMTRETGEGVADIDLIQAADKMVAFETQLATVSFCEL